MPIRDIADLEWTAVTATGPYGSAVVTLQMGAQALDAVEAQTVAALEAGGAGLTDAKRAEHYAGTLIHQALDGIDAVMAKARADGDAATVELGQQLLDAADDAGIPDDRGDVRDPERDEADRAAGEAAIEAYNRARG